MIVAQKAKSNNTPNTTMATSGNHVWNILVVDDEPLVSKSIQMLLQSDGHKVTTVGSGNEGLALLEDFHFDLVIMDFTMPGMNGDELAIAIKERYPSLPVVMTTAYAESITYSGKRMSGVDFLMGKPFSRQELRDAITKALPGT
jgi:CheY-like chemotaxis protein